MRAKRMDEELRKNIVMGTVASDKRALAKQLRQNQTPSEKVFWENVRNNRLLGFHFRRQQVLDGFIVDFYCHKIGLVVEIDGPIHLSQSSYDREREKILRQRGLKLVRFTNEQVLDQLDRVLGQLKQICLRLDQAKNPED